MPRTFDWNDIQVLLALARAGSASGAAAKLGISQPTVGRRLRALEAATGARLIRHRKGQLILSSSGERVLAAAERMERAAAEVSHGVRSDSGTVSPVRITAIPAVAQLMLQQLRAFFASAESPPIELVVTSQALSLPRGEADIALRMGRLPRADGLRCRRLGTVSYALYRSSRNGADAAVPLISDVPTAATHGHQISAQAQWIETEAQRNDSKVRLRISDPALRLEACTLGLGVALLPCLQGDATRGLTRIGQPLPHLTERIYLLAHPDALARAEVRAAFDAITKSLGGRVL